MTAAEGPIRLRDRAGRRRYLDADERMQFFRAAQALVAERRLFCELLCDTGCQVAEALAMTAADVDRGAGTVRLGGDRRRVGHSVPVSEAWLADLFDVFALPHRASESPLWTFSRPTAWRLVKSVMTDAGIAGPQASASGLRHGFAVAAVQAGVPLTVLQHWLGHAQLSTTACYLQVLDVDERALAARLWHTTSDQ